MKLKLDLDDAYNRGDEIDRQLRAVMDEAVQKRAKLAEIIAHPVKGYGFRRGRVPRAFTR